MVRLEQPWTPSVRRHAYLLFLLLLLLLPLLPLLLAFLGKDDEKPLLANSQPHFTGACSFPRGGWHFIARASLA